LAIDLSTPEGRSNYLNDKLSDLINGVDSTYGNIIFDELLKRIDSTIKDFNSEMELVFEELKANEKKKQSVLLKFKKNNNTDLNQEEERQKKEWEKKLLDLYGRDSKAINNDTNETKKGEDKK
jgi:hypothetical protein|tara:strand:+ start:36 stop:404 length:369 start_codon:yes stop_codon:yes gene_type:complete